MGNYINWLGTIDKNADDLRPKDGKPAASRDDAQEWLECYLADGPKPADDVAAAAKAEGFSEATPRRGKAKARVHSYQEKRVWQWKISVPPAANNDDTLF